MRLKRCKRQQRKTVSPLKLFLALEVMLRKKNLEQKVQTLTKRGIHRARGNFKNNRILYPSWDFTPPLGNRS